VVREKREIEDQQKKENDIEERKEVGEIGRER
jgi:hypothetical protein